MGEGSVLGWHCLIVGHVVWYDYTCPSEMGSMVVCWGRSMSWLSFSQGLITSLVNIYIGSPPI